MIIHRDFTHIFPLFSGILLDAYGVFWLGNGVGLIPGAQNTMAELVNSGKIVGILSNSSQLVEKEKEKYRKGGLVEGKHYHFLITSGEVAKSVFIKEALPFPALKRKYWLFGGAHPKYSSPHVIFEGSSFKEAQNPEEADFIFLSIPHIGGEDQTEPELFREEVRKLLSTHLPMVCANPDRFAHEGQPPIPVVRQGAIAALYEEMGGKVYAIGKPYEIVYQIAMKHFVERKIHEPEKILMVGDTPETDIRGARGFHMGSALVIGTGIMAERIVQGKNKNKVLESLPSADRPDYFVESFDKIRV